jgi:nitroreductase
VNSTFDSIRQRCAVRRFSTAEIPDTVLVELLDLANCAPSGFNLQPWHFIVVKSPELKQLIKHIALEQPQATEAPVLVVFVADPGAWKSSYEEVLRLGQKSGKMSERHIKSYRRSVGLMFRTGPLGLFGLAKKIGIIVRRLFKPTPNVITSAQEAAAYVRSQTMLAAATFMIAAKSAQLDTSPMEGFDEERLKKLLAIPASMTVPLIIAVGHALDESNVVPSIRLPLEQKLSIDLFPNRARELPKK